MAERRAAVRDRAAFWLGRQWWWCGGDAAISAILSLPRSTAHPFPLNALLLVDLVRCQAQHNLDSITSIAHLHALQSIRGERHLHRCARAHELVELLLELLVLLWGARQAVM